MDSYVDWEQRKHPPKGWVEYGDSIEAPYGLYYSTERGLDDDLPLWQRAVRLDELPMGRQYRSAKEDVKPKKPAKIDPDFDAHAYGRLEDQMIQQQEGGR